MDLIVDDTASMLNTSLISRGSSSRASLHSNPSKGNLLKDLNDWHATLFYVILKIYFINKICRIYHPRDWRPWEDTTDFKRLTGSMIRSGTASIRYSSTPLIGHRLSTAMYRIRLCTLHHNRWWHWYHINQFRKKRHSYPLKIDWCRPIICRC